MCIRDSLYVIPRFRTAFLDPFAEIPTLSMLCSFFNKDGEPLESSPEHTLQKACKAFTNVTGMEFQAMGELEYYVIAPDSGMFPATDQKGYHESAPVSYTHLYSNGHVSGVKRIKNYKSQTPTKNGHK